MITTTPFSSFVVPHPGHGGYSDAFIKSSKKVLKQFEDKDPFFKKVLESQRKYAAVVVPFTKETNKLGQLIAGAAEVKK